MTEEIKEIIDKAFNYKLNEEWRYEELSNVYEWALIKIETKINNKE